MSPGFYTFSGIRFKESTMTDDEMYNFTQLHNNIRLIDANSSLKKINETPSYNKEC